MNPVYSILWFVIGCSLGSITLGMLVWAEELKSKNLNRLLVNSLKLRVKTQLDHQVEIESLKIHYENKLLNVQRSMPAQRIINKVMN